MRPEHDALIPRRKAVQNPRRGQIYKQDRSVTPGAPLVLKSPVCSALAVFLFWTVHGPFSLFGASKKRKWGESGVAPPVADAASRFRGCGTIGGPGRGRESSRRDGAAMNQPASWLASPRPSGRVQPSPFREKAKSPGKRKNSPFRGSASQGDLGIQYPIINPFSMA